MKILVYSVGVGISFLFLSAASANPIAPAVHTIKSYQVGLGRATPLVRGTATQVGQNLFFTSCHILIGAQRAEIETKPPVQFKSTVAIDSHDVCFLGEMKQLEVLFRPPKKDESVFVFGKYEDQDFVSEGAVTWVNQMFFATTSEWPVGVSGGVILGSDGKVVGIPTFKTIQNKKETHYGIILSNVMSAPGKSTLISNLQTIGLYSQHDFFKNFELPNFK